MLDHLTNLFDRSQTPRFKRVLLAVRSLTGTKRPDGSAWGKILQKEDERMENFKSLAAVLRHLHADGWQIARTQFYRHADAGRLERAPDGTYSLAAVVRYAERFCKRAATGKPLAASKATVAEQRDEIRLEREALKLESERLEFERLAGKLVSFRDVEDMIVARAVAMLAHLKAMVQMSAADWIDLVGGDQARSRELMAAIWDEIEEQLATFARDIEFEVIFEATAGPDAAETADDPDPAAGPSTP